MIRRGMEKVIDWKRLGFQVRASFSDPSEAYQYLKENPVDVILTDMKMPGMSGLELIEKAKELQGDIRSVAMSGYDEFALARKALVLKAEDYLLKPISESDVEKTFSRIRQTLDEERQSKAPREVSQKYADYETLKTLRSDLAAMLERGSAEGISELVQRIADIVSLAEERDQGYLYSYVVKYLTDYFSTSGTFRTLFFADWPQNGSQTQALSLQEMRQRFRDDVDELGRALDTQFDNLITLAELDAKMAAVTVDDKGKGTLKENGVDAVYTVRGYVVGINGQNTMISDGVNGFTIYQNKTAVEVGDKVTVTSTWQKYYSTTQTGTVSSLIKTKVAMDPITEYTVRTGAELVAMSSNSTDNLAGKTFKAENAVIRQEGNYKNLYVGGTKVNTTIVGLNDIELPLDVYGTFTGFIYQANTKNSVLTIWVNSFTANGEAAPTALTISGSNEVEAGLSTTLTVSGVADNFMNADTSVTWGVANKDTGVTEPLATIDQNGVLTAGSTTGVVTVTATSTLAPTVTATFDVTIKAAAALTTHTISFGNNGNAESSTAVNSYTTSWNAVADGVTYTIKNMNRNSQNGGWNEIIKAGSKSAASVASVSTVAPFAKKIGTVTVNLEAVTAAKVNSFKLYVASDAAFANVLEEVSLTPAVGDNVFTVVTPTANCYYKVEFDLQKGSGNGFVSLHSIAFAEVA